MRRDSPPSDSFFFRIGTGLVGAVVGAVLGGLLAWVSAWQGWVLPGSFQQQALAGAGGLGLFGLVFPNALMSTLAGLVHLGHGGLSILDLPWRLFGPDSRLGALGSVLFWVGACGCAWLVWRSLR